MIHVRYAYGPLVVILDAATGRVDAVLHKLADPMRNASELFSPEYISRAVNHALIAWQSTADN